MNRELLTKGQALYVFRPETPDYTCNACVFLKGSDGCAMFARDFKVSGDMGSCNFWSHGERKINVPCLSLYTPEELGYAENPNGFGCRRCSEFIEQKNDCERVDRKSPGDSPGIISPDGCCAAWQKDAKRGKMTDAELATLLGSHTKPVLRFSR